MESPEELAAFIRSSNWRDISCQDAQIKVNDFFEKRSSLSFFRDSKLNYHALS